MADIQIKQSTSTSMGILWFIGWLFTVGFLHLASWQIIFAIIIWPYYLGVNLAGRIL